MMHNQYNLRTRKGQNVLHYTATKSLIFSTKDKGEAAEEFTTNST